jgi:alkylation response protein AidB-like acyl-CoA dehydrogenase
LSAEIQVRQLLADGQIDLPLPGRGQTAERHRQLAAFGRKNLSVARLVEGHVDAVAILQELQKKPEKGALYAVWASDIPGTEGLSAEFNKDRLRLAGKKMFCSGAGIADRALVTCNVPGLLLDMDLRNRGTSLEFDLSDWKTEVFAQTNTATVYFKEFEIPAEFSIANRDWYLDRSGFWHGACGPASCWAGGALRLVDYAKSRVNQCKPHSKAHVGAMRAAAWAIESYLDAAGQQIDARPADADAARIRALMFRHRIEQSCIEVLNRFGRALGPRPLIYDAEIGTHYRELEIYIRQCHAEVDLEGIVTEDDWEN